MKRDIITHTKDIKHFHFCCGLGGGKKGFNRARPLHRLRPRPGRGAYGALPVS